VRKTVALSIGFGFVFIPYPLAKEEPDGDLAEGKCIYRLTPAARANANIFGDAPPPPWAKCTEESVEEEDQWERSTARSGCCWHCCCCCCCPRSWAE
jgi:hypothetical protein